MKKIVKKLFGHPTPRLKKFPRIYTPTSFVQTKFIRMQTYSSTPHVFEKRIRKMKEITCEKSQITDTIDVKIVSQNNQLAKSHTETVVKKSLLESITDKSRQVAIFCGRVLLTIPAAACVTILVIWNLRPLLGVFGLWDTLCSLAVLLGFLCIAAVLLGFLYISAYVIYKSLSHFLA